MMSDSSDDTSIRARLAVLEALAPREREATRERIDLLMGAAKEALSIQTGELARRLGDLNGEAARLRAIQAEYIPRETYYAKHDDMAKAIVALQVAQSNIIGRIAVISAIVGFAVALIVRWILP